jgi:hypothetical protein
MNTSLTVQGNVGIGTTGPQGKLDVKGDIRAGNSDIYFTEPNHNHTGIGNTAGFAAIENAANYDALMILGRAGTARGRMVRLWDYLQVNGGFDVTGDIAIAGKHALRGTDPWLRLNEVGAFTSGVHTPGVFAPGSLNVGGVGGWGNPGSGNAWIAGSLTAQNMVSAQSHGQWAPAVFGQNRGPNGIGVLGRDDSPSGGLAGYFKGKTEVEGNFRVLGGFAKNFRIDHPLAPAEKYLDHTCVESSERKNVYDGVERLDEDGSAWVELPEWFEALNKDFRYQLTAIGGAAPELYVAEEISDNRFRIAGGKAEMKVCWQISGIRSDLGAEANPMVVEEDKPEEERGRYIQPELYGAPKEQRIMMVAP